MTSSLHTHKKNFPRWSILSMTKYLIFIWGESWTWKSLK